MAKEILISAPEGNIHPKTGKRILSVTRQQLLQIFQECRSAETSLDPENRTAEDPSWFQCIATSMVVRDLFYSVAASQKLKVTSEKAKIWKDKHFPMRSEYNDVVHYLNFMKTTNGENKEIDFADEQFKAL
jgi:hypothetical protein